MFQRGISQSTLFMDPNFITRQALIDKVPKIGIHKPAETEIITISGPEKESTAQSYMDFVCAKVCHLYVMHHNYVVCLSLSTAKGYWKRRRSHCR